MIGVALEKTKPANGLEVDRGDENERRNWGGPK